MKDLTVKLQTIDDKVMFRAAARENPAVVIDGVPPVGTGNGYTPMELLLASFGSCVGATLISFLRRKMNKEVDGISIEVEGTKRDEHPKAVERILLRLNITAKDLTEGEVRQALNKLEEKLCPIWAMMKGNVKVDAEISISTINR